VGAGGLEGRDRATGYGVVVGLKAWAKSRGTTLEGKRFIIQGFGNVGYWASVFMKESGARLIAVQDASGAIYDASGIDPEQLNNYISENGGALKNYRHASSYINDD